MSNAQKHIISQLPCIEDGTISAALVSLIRLYAYSLLNYNPDCQPRSSMATVQVRNGIETALGVLERFKWLCGESTSDHLFWEPLCTALKHKVGPFLHCLQTQALLHGIHVHFTVSEKDCPVCQQRALDSALGLFSAKIVLAKLRENKRLRPHFTAFVHRHESRSEDSVFLHSEALEGRDVYILDCFDAISSNNTLELKFFASLMFVQKGYVHGYCSHR